MKTKFVVVSGGVISGVGKGVITASLGKIIKEYGYKTTLIKIDPYLNYDAGTLRPTEHGEVWVTEDGGEIDQDLGTYERFMNEDFPKKNNITTGQVYKAVIDRERHGEYLGQTVQFIPHIPEEIAHRIKQAAEGFDVAIVEIGGTVGDYENVPYLFALKSMERELGPQNVSFVLVTYLPVPGHIDEMKTKPTQQAIKAMNEHGIFPDFIICRSKEPIDAIRKKKIETYAHINSECVIAAPDIDSIYRMPLYLEQEKMGVKLLSKFGLYAQQMPDWTEWKQRVACVTAPKKNIKIAIVGKYLVHGDYTSYDSYVSVGHALLHASVEHAVGAEVTWVDAQEFERYPHHLEQLKQYDGIIVPGGFGASGVEGKISVIEYARTHNIPYLGLCYGMQLAAVEYARHVVGFADAHTTEVNAHTTHPIVDILPLQKELLADASYGGSMRLGGYSATLRADSRVAQLYHCAPGQSKKVIERHRHRYEINPAFIAPLEQKGLVFSGYHERVDGSKLMEYLELPEHRFFVATQAHPEFTSRFGNPNPLFFGFVGAAVAYAHERQDQSTMQWSDYGVSQGQALHTQEL